MSYSGTSLPTVLHVINTLGLGGAERFLTGLVTHLDRGQFHPVVATLGGGGPFVADLQSAGIKVYDLRFRHARDFAGTVRLYRLMRRLRPTIVHTHLTVDGFHGRVAALAAGVPIRVVTQQNAFGGGQFLPHWQRWSNILLVRATQQFIAVSAGAATYLRQAEKVPPEKIVVLPNAVEPVSKVAASEIARFRRELSVPESAPLIGVVARLTPQKGISYLLEALASLPSLSVPPHGVIVGDGVLRAELEARRDRLGLAGRVHFLGHRRDIALILGALDLFVLPSLYEGLSLALLEAMSAGVPVVATAVSGSEEIIVDGENGFLVPAADSAALAKRMYWVLTHPDVRAQVAGRGRETVRRRFTIDAIAGQYEAVYTRLLATRL